jgi:hypothetical protein
MNSDKHAYQRPLTSRERLQKISPGREMGWSEKGACFSDAMYVYPSSYVVELKGLALMGVES